MMEFNRECLTCSKLNSCSRTSVELVLNGHSCHFHALALEPVLAARTDIMQKFGAVPTIRTLLSAPYDPRHEELHRMNVPAPAPGTTYSERLKQLEIMSYVSVRHLAADVYRNQDQTPLVPYYESLAVNSMATTRQKVLDHELAVGLIVPDPNMQQGDPNMAQQFAPPPAPGMPPAPQQMPMAPPPPPGFQAAPYGMAPGVPPGAPPPVATPDQAAAAAQTPPPPAPPAEAAPTSGKKKGKGASVAPPPAPPPAATQFAAPPVPTMPQAAPPAPAPTWAAPQLPQVPQFAPQPPAGAVMQSPQQVVQQAPVAMDLGPVTGLIDQVGKAVNALEAGDEKRQAQVVGLLTDIRNLLMVQVAAIHHLYVTNPALQQAVQGKDVSDAYKFIEVMKTYVPR